MSMRPQDILKGCNSNLSPPKSLKKHGQGAAAQDVAAAARGPQRPGPRPATRDASGPGQLRDQGQIHKLTLSFGFFRLEK